MDRTPGWLVCAALDPVLTPAGFAPGQRGTDSTSSNAGTQVIFCAGHDELSDTHPRLPQANAQERGEGACVDLVVDLAADGTLESLDLEGVPLKETLHAVGLGDAANSLERDLRLPLDQSLPTVAGTLARLLAHGGQPGPHGVT